VHLTFPLESEKKKNYVQFSLSGNVLKLHWGSEPAELIRVDDSEKKIASASSHANKEHSGV
jgi:hypothetical protein